MIDDLGTRVRPPALPEGRPPTLAKAKLFADLPVAYQLPDRRLGRRASEILKQTLTINAMSQAMHSAAGATGTGSVDVYAQTRAEIQTERTYGSIAHAAMKWVPVLNIVLTVVFYALFPVLFPLFLMPKSGPLALKGYVTGFFYLAAWGPLYVILHMVHDVQGRVGGGRGRRRQRADAGELHRHERGQRRYRHARRLSRRLDPVPRRRHRQGRDGDLEPGDQLPQPVARTPPRKPRARHRPATSRVGNTSFDNQTIQTRQHDQWNQAPSFTYGAAQTRAFNDTGTMSTSFAANDLLDVPVSKLPFSPQVTQSVATEASRVASETRTRGETLSNQASESVSNAVSRFNEFRHAVSNDQSIANSYGAEDRSNITSSFNEVDQASRMLQSRFGLRAEVADSIATEKFVSGSVSANAGGSARTSELPRWAHLRQPEARGLRSAGRTAMSPPFLATGRRIEDALESWSTNHGWSQNRDAFDRSVATSSRSDVSSSASGISSSSHRSAKLQSRSSPLL